MAKRRRIRRIRWKAVILFALSVILVLYLLISLIGMLFRPKDTSGFSACRLSSNKLQKKLTDTYEGTMEMGDYVFYGEQLTFYSQAYSLDVANTFVGKTMVLKNVCTGKEIEISKIQDNMYGQIDTASLPEGLYEVYIVENLLRKRLYTATPISTLDNTMYTITRNGTNKKIEVFADATLLNQKDAKENVLDNNYVFIRVTEEKAPEGYYDVVLNPGPITISSQEGASGNGLEEAAEMYRFAVKVKEELEKKGLRVMIAREGTEWVSTYGTDGTVDRAMQAHAKYFISLGMYEGSESRQGIHIMYSHYSNGELADSIFREVVDNTNLDGRDSENAAVKSVRSGVYDTDFDIREAGGMALGAGLYDDAAKANVFATTNRTGIECVSIELVNTKSAEDAKNWSEGFDTIAARLAQGITNELLK